LKSRRAAFEYLEDRTLLSAVPYGATPDDLAEFMLGDVLVTVVLMESSETISPQNPNTEDWSSSAIEAVKQKVTEGMTWWGETLQTQHPTAPHTLNFLYDFTYADTPVETDYEPIANISDNFIFWMYDFLDMVGHNSSGNFSTDIRAFNHAQRLAHETDWAFTIFVANDENDPDNTGDGGEFASGGTFSRAFAFAGGQFFVTPAGRPSSTYAHETGHIFWAKDEYLGAGSYTDQRGYYDAQNLNHASNPSPGFVQADSIMASGSLMSNAYGDHTSSESSLEMIGWRDSDGDGVFDVLDEPLTLTGSGFVDPQAGEYRFVGTSSVATLMNANSSGPQNDITINEISRAEYRIDGVGDWETAATFQADTYTADLDLHIPLPDLGLHTVEVRTTDDDSGVASPVFQGDTTTATSFLQQGINGIVWNDVDDNGQIDPGEPGLSDWTVRLVDAEGEPTDVDAVEPDDYGAFTALDSVNPNVALTAVGIGVDGSVYARAGSPSSTGSNVFNYFDTNAGWGASWSPETRNLRMDFSTPVTAVRLDAIGNSSGDYGRLEAYSAGGTLLARYTTGYLGSGEVETMAISRSAPDIAYAIARGHMNSEINLDNLRFGPETETQTDEAGAYSLTNLPADTYYIQAVAPGSQDPLLQQHQVVLGAEGEATDGIDFDGQAASWRNPGDPSDVNDDGLLTPLDALTVISYINSHPDDLSVPPPPAEPPPYYDVDGNGFVTALDVLIIIDALNAQASSEPSSEPVGYAGGYGEGEYSPTNLARISQQSYESEKQARDDLELAVADQSGSGQQSLATSGSSGQIEPTVTASPLLATYDPNGPHARTDSPSAPPRQDGLAVRSGLWRTAVDNCFRQISLTEELSSTAPGRLSGTGVELDEILPDIAVEITKLTDAFGTWRA